MPLAGAAVVACGRWGFPFTASATLDSAITWVFVHRVAPALYRRKPNLLVVGAAKCELSGLHEPALRRAGDVAEAAMRRSGKPGKARRAGFPNRLPLLRLLAGEGLAVSYTSRIDAPAAAISGSLSPAPLTATPPMTCPFTLMGIPPSIVTNRSVPAASVIARAW